MSDRVEKWKAEHAAGMSTHQIAEADGVHQSTVWTALRRAGFDMSRVSAREHARKFDKSILADYKKGLRLGAIAATYDTTRDVVYKILAEHDSPPRRRSNANKIRMAAVPIGSISALLRDLPEEDLDPLLAAAADRRKSVAEVLVEDWEAQ
jgi:hypothetical protein